MQNQAKHLIWLVEKTRSLKISKKVDFPTLEREGIQRHKAQGDEYIFVIDEYVTLIQEYGDLNLVEMSTYMSRDKDGKEVDFVRFLDDYDDAVRFCELSKLRSYWHWVSTLRQRRDYGVMRKSVPLQSIWRTMALTEREAEEQFLGEFDGKAALGERAGICR